MEPQHTQLLDGALGLTNGAFPFEGIDRGPRMDDPLGMALLHRGYEVVRAGRRSNAPTSVNGGTVPRLFVTKVFSDNYEETINGRPGSGLVRQSHRGPLLCRRVGRWIRPPRPAESDRVWPHRGQESCACQGVTGSATA